MTAQGRTAAYTRRTKSLPTWTGYSAVLSVRAAEPLGDMLPEDGRSVLWKFDPIGEVGPTAKSANHPILIKLKIRFRNHNAEAPILAQTRRQNAARNLVWNE